MHIIPSIEQLRQRHAMRALEDRYGRDVIVDALRAEADLVRARIRSGESGGDVAATDIASTIEAAVAARLEAASAPSLRRVINATGVVIHTNLGRAPLCESAASRLASIAGGYSNLEYDVDAGTRGRRDTHAARLICQLTGAEAAVVVNNNAAATLVALATLAAGREAIVSRGELVEIGGGFRVPDVMAQSGAVLREVGTTNRTRAADYAAAITDRTALILRVHPSNFRIEGFTERPALADLVAIGRRFGVPVIEDLGSGWLGAAHLSALLTARGAPPPRARAAALEDSLSSRGPQALASVLAGEPAVSQSLTAGANLVLFSGDKLLGGPQAGIIAGREELVARIRVHPLMRALRVDKLTYAALEATLGEYAAGRAGTTVPVARMIAMPIEAIRRRALDVVRQLSADGVAADAVDGASTIGGGSAPGATIPTCLVRVLAGGPAELVESRLRRHDPPVVARIEHGRVVLDLRTVEPADDGAVVRGVKDAAR